MNETLNYLNQRKRNEKIAEEIASKGKTPDEIFDEWERNERIQEALMEVPYGYRILIILKHFQGCSYEEIAYILDIPVKKVKSRLFTSRQMLKNVLLKYGMLQNDTFQKLLADKEFQSMMYEKDFQRIMVMKEC